MESNISLILVLKISFAFCWTEIAINYFKNFDCCLQFFLYFLLDQIMEEVFVIKSAKLEQNFWARVSIAPRLPQLSLNCTEFLSTNLCLICWQEQQALNVFYFIF